MENNARAQAVLSLDWLRIGKIGGQLLSLVIFQAAIILVITAISVRLLESANEPRTSESASANTDPLEQLVLDLQGAVRNLVKSGRSYAQIAEETSIGKGHQSMLMNHFDRAKRGDGVLGKAALRGIEAKVSAGRSIAP